MGENACELSSSTMSCNESLLLRGKSIAFQQQQQHRRQPNSIPNKSSINSSRSDTNVNPMRHSKRIKQLFLPVCSHEVKHEIANHYRDAKQKKAAKECAKAKRSVAALIRQRKKAKFAKLVSTAIKHRRRPPPIHRRHFLSQREVLQIPSFTFPR